MVIWSEFFLQLKREKNIERLFTRADFSKNLKKTLLKITQSLCRFYIKSDSQVDFRGLFVLL